MIAVLLFLLPAVWLAYLIGVLIRQGLAVALYPRIGDLVPWLIDHHHHLVAAALALGLVGNTLMLARSHYFKWQRALIAYPLVFGGGVLWLLACLIYPGWVWAPFGGLLMFVVMTMNVLALTVAHYAMREDEIFEVLAWVVGTLALVGALHLLLYVEGLA